MAPFPTPEISPSPATMHPFPASLAYTLYIGAWVELYRMVRQAIQLCEVTSM